MCRVLTSVTGGFNDSVDAACLFESLLLLIKMGSGDFHSDLQHLSLSASYQRLSELLGGVDAGAAAPPAQTQEAQHLLSHCEDLIERAALFSSNEDKDDLVTSHLKYLLVSIFTAGALHFRHLASCENAGTCAGEAQRVSLGG